MHVKRRFYAQILLLPVVCIAIDTKYVDIYQNITIECPLNQSNGIMWERDTRDISEKPPFITLEDGSLFLENVTKNDSGEYRCSEENSAVKYNIQVVVKTPPPALPFYVHPSTILAYLIWQLNGTGGYPITFFTAEYRLMNESNWTSIAPTHLSPNLRRLEVYKLEPNTTYAFRMWAGNKLGPGVKSEVINTTLHIYTEKQLAARLLAGAQTFDTRIWIIAVAIVMGTLTVLGLGTCLLLYQECRTGVEDEQEVIELVPNIILNPGFEGNMQADQMPADENCNNETPVRLNNNTVVQPRIS
ncbi:cell adhesion molecule DSCAM isoform X1 [Onthophagus taurus]|uniref:cell adhesion molecule DSCAM isoform X1 n=1 Tax=Onthophagus taurus TaxID=166361 RepID=UPI0039BE1474